MRSVNPEKQLVLVTRVEVIVKRTFAFATNPFVADKKVSARAESHENVIVQVAKWDDIFEAELQDMFVTESFCI